jgi:hypothetical protein
MMMEAREPLALKDESQVLSFMLCFAKDIGFTVLG